MDKKKFDFERSLTLEELSNLTLGELSDYEINKDLEINLMEDPFFYDEICKFFDIFFNHKNFTDDNYKLQEENQELFDRYFPIFLALYTVRKDEYNEIISGINIGKNDFSFFEKELKKAIKYKGFSKYGARRFLLSFHYDVENAVEKLYKIVKVANEKGIKEFIKETDKNNRLKDIALVFSLIYNEKKYHYKNFIEILKDIKKVDEIKIHKFEKEIIEFFRKTEIENLPLEKEIATKIGIMILGSDLGILNAFHLGVYKDKQKEDDTKKDEEKSFLN